MHVGFETRFVSDLRARACRITCPPLQFISGPLRLNDENLPPVTWRQRLWVLAPVLILAMAIVARAICVARSPEATGSGWLTALVTLRNDGPLFAAFGSAVWLVFRFCRGAVQRLFRFAMAGFLLLFLCDVVMIAGIGTRLSWGRLLTYGALPEVVFNYLRERFGLGVALVLLGGIAGLVMLIVGPTWRREKRVSRTLLVSAVLSGAVVLLPRGDDYVRQWMRENVVMLNRPSSQKKPYTKSEAERLVTAYRQGTPTREIAQMHGRRNVILLVIESWSSYHSKAFGGVKDWTPELDQIARAHTRYTRFHAGGYCTAEGLVNLFSGVRLWMPYGGLSGLDRLPEEWIARESLPQVFNQAGYQTAFLTTGPLSFVGKGKWLNRIGFDYVEGGEHSFYDDWPKRAFFSATDEALYKRSLQWMEERSEKRPFFLTVETVSSHMPYVDPVSQTINPEKCFGFADHWAAWFVRELEARGFFEHGILMITGDHRAMVPLRPEEKEVFGLGALSRVPFVLIDRQRPAGEEIDWLFKQGDLVPSFQHWLGQRTELDALAASIFEERPNPENVALHRRGNERATVDVIFADGEGQVEVAGDATNFRWANNISAERRQRVLSMIAYERLSVESDEVVRAAASVRAAR